MFINQRDDTVPTALPSVSAVAPVDIDNTPLPPTAMIAIKIYAFGGLALMIGIVIAGIGYWIWTVVIKREFADSPAWLELHPERMREQEKARVARLKARKEEVMLERRRREEDKFTPPPVRYERKQVGRDRSCSAPVKPATRQPSIPTNNTRDRKSSLSSSPSKGKRVSWASSTSTLDVVGNASEKPLDRKISPRSSLGSPFHPIPPYDNPLSPVPKARTSIPRSSTSVEPRSRRGPEMIAATTPDMAVSWAKTDDPFASKCNCGAVDPLYVSNPNYCEMHPSPYRD